MRISFAPSKQSIVAGLLAVAVLSFGSIVIDLYQRAHGFTDSLFLILGFIMLAAGVPLCIVSRHKPPPPRSINIWVFIGATVTSCFLASPAIYAALWLTDLANSYLSIRAWLLAMVGYCGVFLLLIFLFGSCRIQR